MSEPLPPWLANLDPRLVRPDWKKWLRPDWQRWMPPDPGPSLRERLWCPYREEPGASFEAQPAPRSELARLDRPYRHEPANPSGTRATGSATPRTDLALLRFKIAMLKLRLKALHPSHYDPNQPRVPAGNSILSGRWTQVAGPPGIGQNHDGPPEIPKRKPPTAQERNAFIKGAARWIAKAARVGGPVGSFVTALEMAS